MSRLLLSTAAALALCASTLPLLTSAQDAHPYPTNCCNYRFADPAFPLVDLPAEGGDISLIPSNPLVTNSGAAVQCNGDKLSVWNIATKSFERTYTNNAGEVKAYDHVVYITASDQLYKSTSQVTDSQMRDALLSGKLVQLALDCGTGETSGQCVQFATGTTATADARWNDRPACLLGGGGGETLPGDGAINGGTPPAGTPVTSDTPNDAAPRTASTTTTRAVMAIAGITLALAVAF